MYVENNVIIESKSCLSVVYFKLVICIESVISEIDFRGVIEIKYVFIEWVFIKIYLFGVEIKWFVIKWVVIESVCLFCMVEVKWFVIKFVFIKGIICIIKSVRSVI